MTAFGHPDSIRRVPVRLRGDGSEFGILRRKVTNAPSSIAWGCRRVRGPGGYPDIGDGGGRRERAKTVCTARRSHARGGLNALLSAEVLIEQALPVGGSGTPPVVRAISAPDQGRGACHGRLPAPYRPRMPGPASYSNGRHSHRSGAPSTFGRFHRQGSSSAYMRRAPCTESHSTCTMQVPAAGSEDRRVQLCIGEAQASVTQIPWEMHNTKGLHRKFSSGQTCRGRLDFPN